MATALSTTPTASPSSPSATRGETSSPSSQRPVVLNPKSAQALREAQALQHSPLPWWILWVQSNVLLPALLLADAYVYGTLLTTGWVRDIEDPTSWGIFHGAGVVLFFIAGATCAGITLSASYSAGRLFSSRRFGFGVINLLVVLLFAGSEVWANIAERSAHYVVTPADAAVMATAFGGATLGGVTVPTFHLSVAPTVLVIAFLLPLAGLAVGWTVQTPREDPEEKAERERRAHDLKMLQKQHKAQERAATFSGWAQAAKAGVKALTTEDEPAPSPEGTAAFTPDEDPDPDGPDGDGGPQGGPAGTGGRPGKTETLSSGKPTRLEVVTAGNRTGVPRDRLTAQGLISWVYERYGVVVPPEEALAFIKAMPGVLPLNGKNGMPTAKGFPWAAPKAATIQRARLKWGEVPTAQAEGE